MIEHLYEAQPQSQFGGKINALLTIRNLGGIVPQGLILPENLVSSWWRPQIKQLLEEYSLEELTSDFVWEQLPSRILPENMKVELRRFLEDNKTYIVRSSALLEDGVDTSFAGQYESVLDCQTIDEIEIAIRTCIASLFSPQSLAYWHRYSFEFEQLRLALLIQEQVSATVSGVCFSIDPQSDEDQTLFIEYIDGQGKALVDGSRNPYRLKLPWYKDLEESIELLSPFQLLTLRQTMLTLLSGFGRPLDVEFAFAGNELYILQARPITALTPTSQNGRWTTANFRDGGVAAQPCPNLMFSLYRHVWQQTLSRFMEEAHLVKKERLGALIQLKFARPYWNLGEVKAAMSQIPGYIERDFDDELGVQKNYEGTGFKTRMTPKSVLHVIRVAVALKNMTTKHHASIKENYQRLLNQYQDLTQCIQNAESKNELETLWLDIVNRAQFEAEGYYFWQVFINTVQLSMKKTTLLKWLSPSVFFDLIAHLGNVSHLQPLEAILTLAETIEKEPIYLNDWKTKSVAELATICQSNKERLDSQALLAFQKQFGYHSKRELNLLVPSYSEDLNQVIEQVQHFLSNKDKANHIHATLQDKSRTDKTWEELKSTLPTKRYRQTEKMVAELRDLLWWREAFKDISTRYYHLVRQVSLKLARLYQKEGLLQQVDDIFYLEKEETTAFINGDLLAMDLQELADKNRHYCYSYQNFEPNGDLYEENITLNQSTNIQLNGLPANSGLVTAKVRVLENLQDIHLLKEGEILVTRFTDTGWSYAFASLAGLITEYGGVLCHASIVARECKLPALVCVKDATTHLKTGMLITLDAHVGKIIIHEEDLC